MKTKLLIAVLILSTVQSAYAEFENPVYTGNDFAARNSQIQAENRAVARENTRVTNAILYNTAENMGAALQNRAPATFNPYVQPQVVVVPNYVPIYAPQAPTAYQGASISLPPVQCPSTGCTGVYGAIFTKLQKDREAREEKRKKCNSPLCQILNAIDDSGL